MTNHNAEFIFIKIFENKFFKCKENVGILTNKQEWSPRKI